MTTGNRRTRTLILLLVIPVFLGSCVLFQTNVTYYYLLEDGAPGDEFAGASQTDTTREGASRETLIVEEPMVSSIYERRQIVQRTQGPQLTFLSSDLWAVNPSQGVQNLLLQRLRDASLFGAVEAPGREVEAPYRLVSTIDRLEFDVREDAPRASVFIRLSLQDARTGDELVTVGGSRSQELRESTPYLFAVAVNAILKEEIDTLVAEIIKWSRE